jgi:polar amino acid transport system substrate-binding protein
MKNIIKALAIALILSFALVTMASCSAENVVVVGYTIYEPMNYKNENGELVGFDTELAEKVFTNLGYKVSFKEITWEQKYTELNSGSIDCIWNGFTSNGSDDGTPRAELVDFSYNYMENKQVVVVKADSGITSAEGLKDQIGKVEASSAGEAYAKTFEGAIVQTVTKQTEAIFEVFMGTAKFAVVDAQLAKSLVGKGDYANLQIIETLSSEVEYYGIGFKKGSELTAKVNEQLEALAANGYLKGLAEKYGVENATILDYSDQKK